LSGNESPSAIERKDSWELITPNNEKEMIKNNV